MRRQALQGDSSLPISSDRRAWRQRAPQTMRAWCTVVARSPRRASAPGQQALCAAWPGSPDDRDCSGESWRRAPAEAGRKPRKPQKQELVCLAQFHSSLALLLCASSSHGRRALHRPLTSDLTTLSTLCASATASSRASERAGPSSGPWAAWQRPQGASCRSEPLPDTQQGCWQCSGPLLLPSYVSCRQKSLTCLLRSSTAGRTLQCHCGRGRQHLPHIAEATQCHHPTSCRFRHPRCALASLPSQLAHQQASARALAAPVAAC